MKDRIAHIMRAKNLKASDFASLLGIQPSAVSHILAGRNKPSLEIVRKIKETFPEYNLDYRENKTGASRWDYRLEASSLTWTGNAFDFYHMVVNRIQPMLPNRFHLNGLYEDGGEGLLECPLAYQQLMTRNGLTQEELSQHVGKSRATVANFMRLLRLPAEIQLALKDRRITMGHARALLSIEDAEQQVALYHQIVAQDLSVRRVESLVREFVEGRILDFRTEGQTGGKKTGNDSQLPEELFGQMTQHLSEMFSTKVRMSCNEKGQGKIIIPFKSDEELRNIIALLDKLN